LKDRCSGAIIALMNRSTDKASTDQALTGQPTPLWIRAMVGALLSLIPSTLFAVIIVVIAMVLPLVLPSGGGWAGVIRPALLLIAGIYIVNMVSGAVQFVRRTR
jgi:hypothetical protein